MGQAQNMCVCVRAQNGILLLGILVEKFKALTSLAISHEKKKTWPIVTVTAINSAPSNQLVWQRLPKTWSTELKGWSVGTQPMPRQH